MKILCVKSQKFNKGLFFKGFDLSVKLSLGEVEVNG